MLVVDRPIDLSRYVGKTLGTSDWVTIDQAMIDGFAQVTGDQNWYHIDVERARRDMPGGRTIAHGYLDSFANGSHVLVDLRDSPTNPGRQLWIEPASFHATDTLRLAHPLA